MLQTQLDAFTRHDSVMHVGIFPLLLLAFLSIDVMLHQANDMNINLSLPQCVYFMLLAFICK